MAERARDEELERLKRQNASLTRWRADDAVVRRPKSAFAKAVNYLHRQWDALILFLQQPEIELHNNRSELLLRGPVTGRRAWLFAGSRTRTRSRGARQVAGRPTPDAAPPTAWLALQNRALGRQPGGPLPETELFGADRVVD